MISAITLVCALQSSYCNSASALDFAKDVDAEVSDERLRALVVVMAHHESGLLPNPKPQSFDALNGTSCGYLQMRCRFVRSHTVREQIHEWIRNVEQTSLACVCGSCKAKRLAASRVSEAERLLALPEE